MLPTKLILLLFLCAVVTCRRKPFYRKDYTYIEELDAFYKLHLGTKGNSWNDAFLACDQEGAVLFYPEKPDEWDMVYNATGATLANLNLTDIFVGIHNEGTGGFLTVDGHSTPVPLINEQGLYGDPLCVTLEIETGLLKIDQCTDLPEDSPRPYVCKKVEDVTCPTIDRGYFYLKETGKCYKVNDRFQTWRDASFTCYMEGGLLAVVESEAEAKLLKTYLNLEQYFGGFRKISPNSDYYTLKGLKLHNSYYKWYDNNYNNNNNIITCGIFYNDNNVLYTMSTDCNLKNKFICEMDINN